MQGIEVIVKIEKAILKKRGIISSDYCRSPFYTLDEREVERIDSFLAEFAEWLK
jgi:4-hydroxy-tetrahydrodipicolinate synthase